MTYVQPNQAYTSKPLTNHSLGYFQDAGDFIATKLLPIFPVPAGERTGDIYTYGKEALRIVDTERGIWGGYNKINLRVEKSGIYRLDDYGLSGEVLDEDLRFAENPVNPEIDMTETITQKLMIDMEKKAADSLTSTGVVTQNVTLSGADQWNEYTTSDPFADIQLGITTVRTATGKIPNTLMLSWDTFQTLLYHPFVLASFPGAVIITKEMLEQKLAMIFGFQEVIVGKALYNSSNMGNATQTLANIWSKVALVCYIEKTPQLKTQTLGWTFTDKSTWNVEARPKSTLGEESIRRRVNSMIIVSMMYDQVLINVACAYLIKNAIA